MMMPEDVKIVADRVHEILAAKRPAWKPEAPKTPTADLTGRWDVRIEFAAGSSRAHVPREAAGQPARGHAPGRFRCARFLRHDFRQRCAHLEFNVGEVHGAALSYRFTGKLEGDKMSGALDMGEYLGAKWTATRHSFGRGGDQG